VNGSGRRQRFRLLAFIAALVATTAQAARPLVTEDAGVLDRGDCELEGAFSRVRGDGPAERGGALQLACGAGLQTQLAAAIATTRADGERTLAAAAIGKTALRELTDEQAGIALAYSFGGERPPGMGWRYDVTSLVGVVTMPARADLLLHLNAGASRSRVDRQTTAVWAAAVELLDLGGSGFDLMAETFGTHREPLWLNAGVRYTVIDERLTVNASYGAQRGSERTKLATLGFKLNF
jgi:hypothetical protein